MVESEDSIICQKFHLFFVNSVLDINQNIADARAPDSLFCNDAPGNQFKFQKITKEKLKTICFSLSKTAGIGNLNCNTIQDCVHVIGEFLLIVINQSLEEGIFPEIWTESLVIPIPKVRGAASAEEFRLINMLHVLEKVLELVVKEQSVEFLTRNVLLISEKSGYRQGHSCETALNLVLAR